MLQKKITDSRYDNYKQKHFTSFFHVFSHIAIKCYIKNAMMNFKCTAIHIYYLKQRKMEEKN